MHRLSSSSLLLAIAEGFHLLGLPDEERLGLGLPINGALYAWCQAEEKR